MRNVTLNAGSYRGGVASAQQHDLVIKQQEVVRGE